MVMDILVRNEEPKDYRRVEEITRAAFSYPGRIEQGGIICSHARVITAERTIPVLNFGPISVLPEYQRKGVGKALIRAMIQKATRMGFGAILFFGRPEYYPQFGFREASVRGITDKNATHTASVC